MTFEQLRILQAVVSEGSIRAASKKVYKTAPAISSMIRKLEEDVGIKILSRESYRPQLTEYGRIFHEKSREVMSQFNNLELLGRRLSKDEDPTIRIAINASCPLAPILNTIHKIDKLYPDTRINVCTENQSSAVLRLKDGLVDMAISTKVNFAKPMMHTRPFITVPFVTVCRSDFHLANVSGLVSIEEQSKYNRVMLLDSSIHRENVDRGLTASPRHNFVSDIQAKKEMILAGLGWGRLPQHVVQKELNQGLIVPISVEGLDNYHLEHFLIRSADRPFKGVFKAIWRHLLLPFEDTSNKTIQNETA